MTLHGAKRLFAWVAIVTLLLKGWLAWHLPMTSDEAFFHLWSTQLGWGYYDHPPMIGWWLWALGFLGDHPFAVRLPTIPLTTALAYGVVLLARRLLPAHYEPQAWLAGAVYLSLPISWISVLVTTDTPLIYFMGLSIFTYVLAIRIQSGAAVFLAGVFLGLAFLSKYFAVLLGVAYAVHLFGHPKRFRYLALLLAGVMPFAAVNIGYNLFNCWNNVMFNAVNRHDDADFGVGNLFTYLGMMLYLATPWVLWRVFKGMGAWRQYPALWVALWVPLGLFLLMSLGKTVGLHWVLGFLPVLFVLLALAGPARALRPMVWANVAFGVPHAIALGLLLHAEPDVWQNEGFAQDIRFHRDMPEILQGLTADMPTDGVLTTYAYSPAALMTFHYGRVVPVFGPGKYHARNDDTFVDWREMDGKPIRIVARDRELDTTLYADYLSNIRVRNMTVAGVPFQVVDGDSFNYPLFRTQVLGKAVEQYYQIPSVLPVLGCPYATKYGFETECRLGDWGLFEPLRKAD